MGADNDIVESFRTDMTCAVRLRRPLLECEVTEWADKLAAEIGRLRGEVAQPEWTQDVIRCLSDIADEFGHTGRGNRRFVELLDRIRATPVAPAPAMPNGVEGLVAEWEALIAHPDTSVIMRNTLEHVVRQVRAADNRDAAGGYNPAAEAIQFALTAEEGLAFLRAWNEGDFAACRMEWPEAPDTVYIGADPLIKTPAAVPAGEAVATVMHGEGGPGGVMLKRREGFGWHMLPHGTKLYAHPSACELGAVREVIDRRKAEAEKRSRAGDGYTMGWSDGVAGFARELEAALQHRGDSRGGEG